MKANFPVTPQETPLAVLAEGCFGTSDSKFATGIIRYGSWPIAVVIDSTCSGRTVREHTDIPCDAPIVATLQEALKLEPKALLLGIAAEGGALPEAWFAVIAEAIRSGLHIINGAHMLLKTNSALLSAAQSHNVVLWDVREASQDSVIAKRRARPAGTKVVTMVGSDCSVGKMCTALELYAAAKKQLLSAEFVATGQTGIVIAGRGVPLDRVIGDFMAGQIERCIIDAIEESQPQFVFVEGQGSLIHPGYSGVTLALLHGSNPDALILCHNPRLTTLEDHANVPIPSLKELINIYESAASWINGQQKQARVVGISLNCSSFEDGEARRLVEKAEEATGLPVTDPIRFGCAPLLKALIPARRDPQPV